MSLVRRLAFTHLKAGYTSGFTLLLSCVDLIALIDVVRAKRLGIDPSLALVLRPEGGSIVRGVAAFLIFAVVVPVLIAPATAVSQGRHSVTRVLRTRSLVWTSASIFLALLAGYATVVVSALERLSGLELLVGNPMISRPALGSLYLWIQNRAPSLLLGAVLLVGGALRLATPFLNLPKLKSLDDYLARLEFQVLPGRFAPVHGRRKLNFNAGGLAPMLEGVRKEWVRQIDEYQILVPGTVLARKYLEDCWSDCKALLRSLGVAASAGRQLRLFSGTSRALERALAELPSELPVVLSPYEHKSEHIVAMASRRVEEIEVQEDFLELPWREQSDKLVGSLARLGERVECFIFLISEVCWATGLRIPIEELVPKVHSLPKGRPLVVIDGAHAVGNCSLPHPLTLGDAYVFSAHKWLLAPEPCGILMSANAAPVYDAWVEEVPDTTMGPADICGLRSSLKLISSLSDTMRRDRVVALKARLLSAISPCFVVVGSRTELTATSLMAVKVAAGFRWKDPSGLASLFARREANVRIIDDPTLIGTDGPWIRISTPFFSDWGEVLRFGQILVSLVEERGG